MRKQKKLLVIGVMVIATVVMGLSFVSSIGRTIEMSKLRTLKMEKVKLDMSKLMNKYFNELNSGDFLEKKHELLNYVKVENPWIVDIQSVDRKEEYLNIEVITNDNEVKTIACSLEDVFNKIPSLNEKDVEIKEENKKEKKKIEKELEKMEKKKKEIENNISEWRKVDLLSKLTDVLRGVL